MGQLLPLHFVAHECSGWDERSAASITQLKSFRQEYRLNEKINAETMFDVISFVNLGAGIGAFLSLFLNDKLGRIQTIRIYLVMYAVGSLSVEQMDSIFKQPFYKMRRLPQHFSGVDSASKDTASNPDMPKERTLPFEKSQDRMSMICQP